MSAQGDLGLVLPERPRLKPVMLEQVRACHFKRKPPDPETGRKRIGCARCGRAKSDPAHFGAPASFNVLSSGVGSSSAGPMVYAGMKRAWQTIFVDLLRASRLPAGLAHVLAEGEITFPDRRTDRDQGNFRVVIEKALGDALQEGGWLVRDDWSHYEFGGLAQRYQRGESATRLVLFPTPSEARDLAGAA